MSRRRRSQEKTRVPVRRQPRRVRVGILAGPVFVALFLILARFPNAIEAGYTNGLYRPIVEILAAVSSRVRFSLTDVIFVVVVSIMIISPINAFITEIRGGRSALRAFLAGGVRLAGEAGWIWSLFLLVWGFNYLRPAPEEIFALDEPPTAEKRRAIVEEVGATIDALRPLLAEDERGVVRPTRTLGELDRELRTLQRRALKKRDVPFVAVGRAKSLLASRIVIRWGPAGVYGPFTAEPNVVLPAPPVGLPYILAHERAHLSGFASEDGASFVGLLTLWESDDPELLYSAWFVLWQHLDGSSEGRDPGVARDLAAFREFVKEHRGAVAPAFDRAYDTFLKAHRVEGGTKSYGRVAELALRELAKRDAM